LRGFSGSVDDIKANSFSTQGPQYVDVKQRDAGLEISGCLWDAAANTPPFATPGQPFGPGQYVVGAEIGPGRYSAPGSESCYWERVRSFSGKTRVIIANNFGGGQQVVDIKPGDAGFSSTYCGDWSPA
jgi:hypothetical protein